MDHIFIPHSPFCQNRAHKFYFCSDQQPNLGLRSFVVRGSGGVVLDVIWVEPAGTLLKSSQLLGSDLVSSSMVLAEV